MMRWLRFLGVVLILGLAGTALAQVEALTGFARDLGLRDAAGFAETVTSLRQTGRLPARYITKNEAERRGWRPGTDLCRAVPGRIIGGDRFGNFERRLPEAPGRRWQEADLDFNCGARNARRLVWSSDGLYFVTIDHYASFRRVP